jgi:signal transduction histidine kinase/CheY-like chemotaxis protein
MPVFSTAQVAAIIAGGALSGLFGWIATRTLITATQWSLFYFDQARQEMEDARDQKLELKQIQEDLLQANQELARLSDRLKAMQQVAEEARQAKEEFAANVSHELRTPLNMIIGFSEMITQSPHVYGMELPAVLLADIDAIQRNSQQLSRLVNDVLDLSRIEAGRMALSKEWASLHEIVDEAAVAVRALFESKGLYLEAEISPDLPLIFCDGTRIHQVVLNLVSNAGRFTERGGVRVSAHREDGDVLVSVSDTGPGIPPEDHERLFEPFQQLDASIRRQHGGTGLGLSISRRFVEMHGGKMWLESEPGVGTTFHFSLPLEVSLSGEGGGRRAMRWFNPYSEYEYKRRTRRSKAPTLDVLPRFVLLEEGNSLRRLFDRYWDEVEFASVRDGEQALHALRQSPAQALIMNTSPFAEAPLSTSQLANLPYDTPAVTCWVPGEDDAARRLGVVRYLVKPIARETLLATLEDLGQDVRTVLVVDDDPEALQLFVRMLSTAGRDYRVVQAAGGQRALSMLRQRQPDVMLLDLIMPGVDGFEVLQRKSEDAAIREIPTVVVTSRDPMSEPIVSKTLTVARSGGLSVSNLLACIEAISQILSPIAPPGDQEQPGNPAA